ncbi:mannose-6-phosphate isomerase [Apibacter sp. ESL0432]|uniref:type I phosphomannose isomerase catalytic subunit n=1 Tax=Apibacter sp. ESL0432 TaxID=2704652 RepID=UPI001C6A6309|nr:type I phosphomannose isomerase catalytic subunit [Apibacter sp. ESL0432]QYN49550.1 mannose-6-phosphate isomerase [Apibacter sp. ESL0432]
MSLYPLVFQPSYHYRIWGGNKLKQFGKESKEEKLGESWEISTVPGYVSIVNNGSLKGKNLDDLIKEYKDRLVGKKVYKNYGDKFPLLIKFLDAAQPLSVQVHPNDEYAAAHHHSFGKTEMWYVLDSEPNSEIILGFEKGTNKTIFTENIEKNTLDTILRKIHPDNGSVIYIPSGRVHALGKGISVVEIQQNSDVTYRIYDYDRIDKDGKKRELHLDQAKEVMDYTFVEDPFSHYDKDARETTLLASPYFTVSSMEVTENKILNNLSNSFRILICLEGECTLLNKTLPVTLKKGDTVLLPAEVENVEVKPLVQTKLLEVHID